MTVLRLQGAQYTERGVFGRGAAAASAAFVGLSVDVTDLFDAD